MSKAEQDNAALHAEMSGNLAAAHAAASRLADETLEIENEKRIAHLQQQAARRISNAGIAKGFTTWQGQWEEAARQKRMLAAAAGRLARPALAAAVAHWVGDWRAAEAAAADAAKQLLAWSSTLERSQLLYACTLRNL